MDPMAAIQRGLSNGGGFDLVRWISIQRRRMLARGARRRVTAYGGSRR
jgi:hypothetical protein